MVFWSHMHSALIAIAMIYHVLNSAKGYQLQLEKSNISNDSKATCRAVPSAAPFAPAAPTAPVAPAPPTPPTSY